MDQRISLCMIARDEAAHLPRCLGSVRGAVDEIIVLDTGSKDATAEIARSYGARVESFAWGDDFAAARNASLALATGDWVLVLDADEELPEATRTDLRPALAATRAHALQVRMRNFSPPGELLSHEESPITRIFVNRPEHRYEGTIHEQMTPSIVRSGGRVEESDLVVLHHGYAQATAQGGVSRARRNLVALENAVRRNENDAYAWFQIGCTQKALGIDADAVSAFQRALALDEEGDALGAAVRATAFAKLGQIALAARDDVLGAELAEACLALDPTHALALQLLGVARAGTGDAPGAVAAFRRLLASANLNPAVRGDLEKLIAALGNGGR